MRRRFEQALLGLVILIWLSQLFIPGGGVGFVTAIVVFLIVWWMVFFMTLPLRVESQVEAGQIVPGSESGAPSDPRLKWKMWVTTVITCGLWLVYFVVFEFELFTLDMIPVGWSPEPIGAS